MSTLEQSIYQMTPPFLVMGFFALLIRNDERRRRSRGERAPVQQKMLRPPGHSLSKKFHDIRLDAMSGFMAASVIALVFGASLAHLKRVPDILAVTIVCGVPIIAGVVWTFRKLLAVRKLSLGLRGEQFVAQELTETIGMGYRVFHDFPGGENWNIDHVIVGQGGTLAIETKTRRKRTPIAGRSEFKAIIEGDRVIYGWCDDAEAIPQARRNAQSLAKFLTSATGTPVTVSPVLAIPGWFVECKTRNDVVVLSARMLASFFRKLPRVLDDERIRRIAHQIDQKCRDIEM